MLTDDAPIYQQLADRIADDIVSGTYQEGAAVPSTNEYSAFYQISPITAAKGVNVLVEQGVLYKKRGIGMFVADGAREVLRERRRARFREQYIAPLVHEARLLGISADEAVDMITSEDRS
jgi:GntR family transcriptional regulator